MKHRAILSVSLVAAWSLFFSNASLRAAEQKPIHALILTGHDGPFHKWRETSKALKEVLEQDERFKVRVVEDPAFLGNADLLGYDVVVQNYVNWERPGLSDKAKNGLVNFLKAGKGLAVIHFANGAFHSSLPKAEVSDWPEYRRIVRRVWDHKDKQCGHDAYGKFSVRITDIKHPITEGMKTFDTIDELYFRQNGTTPIEPLIVAKSKVTGKEEPLAWAYEYEKGRVFQTLLGHAAESIRGEGPATLITRGCVWAAQREQKAITASPPPPPPGSLTLVEGKFGKALDARATPVAIDGNERYRTPPLTVECWAKLNNKKAFNVLIASDTKASGRHWEMYSYAGTGNFSVYMPGMQPSEIKSKSYICDGQWHYLAMTYDARQVRLFVDGKQVHEEAVAVKKDVKPQDGPLTIGMALAALREKIGCDGLIDEVRISSTIRKIEGTPSGPLPLDLHTIGHWRFDHEVAADVDPAWTPRPAEGDAPPWEKATDKDWIDPRFQQMETGPFLDATFSLTGSRGKETIYKGTAIRVGDKGNAGVLYDRCQMRFTAAWSGGWLTHSSRRFALLNTPTPTGKVHFSTSVGPGWADEKGKWDSKLPATAPLPRERLHYRGLYTHGSQNVLRYSVNGVSVLESPGLEIGDSSILFTRSLEVAPSRHELRLLVCELPEKQLQVIGNGRAVLAPQDDRIHIVSLKDRIRGIKLVTEDSGRVILVLPANEETTRVKLLLWEGEAKNAEGFDALASKSSTAPDLGALTKGGPPRWKTLTTRGEIGKDDGSFAVDTLTIPYENPFKALFFVTGVDVLSTGDLAICTAHGDVWIVSGVDDKLGKLTWKRFATGLYQPMGLRVVAGKIIVLERGQLTRLHDLNDDGEADYYENLCNDWHTGGGEHSFDTCLEVGPDGSFYFFKTGDTHTPSGGCLLRVDRDGKASEVFATGFRHPIGLGMSPTGVLSGADQEGNWMPATRIDLYKKGGFYGDMRAHHRETPPKTYDPPLCWLPRQVDNSAGGQVWIPKGKWGPLGGMMLHLSYGKCRMLLVLPQKVEDVMQAGAVDLGLQFLSGIKTGRFHPIDGNLYVVGLQGWQSAAVKDGCLQRVRYTGKKITLPVGLSVHTNGVKLTFAEPLSREHVEDVRRFTIEQWNYHWSADYGSQRWSVSHPERVGQDRVSVKSAKLLENGKSVFLEIADIKQVMQMQIRYSLTTSSGDALSGNLHHTIHRPAPPFKP